MYQNPPIKPANPFMDPSQRFMADLIGLINADLGLTTTRRQNLASSIRRFCAALGYEPGQVPANHWYFRERLKRFHPLEADIAKKRWQTIKSDVGFALRRAGIDEGQPRALAPYSAVWLELKDGLPGTRFNWGLSRLARFCGNQNIAPAAVNDAVLEAFAQAKRRIDRCDGQL